MRFRISKKKNWRKSELNELRNIVNFKTNEQLCEQFNVSIETLRNTMQKYNIKRDSEVLKQERKERMTGENNPNWDGGVSKDTARYLRIQRERHPEHKHARDAVYRALKSGALIKPLNCEDCNEIKPLSGHHEDYLPENWLKVKWVCRICHRKRHKGLH